MDCFLFEGSDSIALTESRDARRHQVEAGFTARPEEARMFMITQEVVDVVDEGGSQTIIMDLIEPIDEQERATFAEQRQQGIAQPLQLGLPSDHGEIFEQAEDRSMDVLMPLSASYDHGGQVQVRQH